MLKTIILFLMIFINVFKIYGQISISDTITDTITDCSIYIKHDYIEGIIFTGNCPINKPINKKYVRWDPGVADIIIVENYIKDFINKKSKNHIKDTSEDYPLINQNLENYKRQYIGYLNKRGQKIIYVNFIWYDYKQDRSIFSIWKEGWIFGYNQGTKIWEIKVNLDKHKCFDYFVNKVKKNK
jgi:hypothetical protein